MNSVGSRNCLPTSTLGILLQTAQYHRCHWFLRTYLTLFKHVIPPLWPYFAETSCKDKENKFKSSGYVYGMPKIYILNTRYVSRVKAGMFTTFGSFFQGQEIAWCGCAYEHA